MTGHAGSGLRSEVTALGYGAWAIGGVFGPVGESDAIRSIHGYLDTGGRFIDTARAYGVSEALVGKAVRTWSGTRPIIATKILGHGPRSRWGRPAPVDVVFPRGSIRASVNESLEQLGVDALDLVQFHLYWPTWGTEGYWLDELIALQREGRVRAIGASMPDYRHDLALPLVLGGVVDSIQTVINLFDPLALDAVVPLAAARGIAVIARGVLDEGGLAGVLATRTQFAPDDIRATFFRPAIRAEYRARLRELEAYVPEHGGSVAELAIRAVAFAPGVTTAIISMPRIAQVEANAACIARGPLTPEVAERLLTHHRWVRNFFEPRYRD